VYRALFAWIAAIVVVSLLASRAGQNLGVFGLPKIGRVIVAVPMMAIFYGFFVDAFRAVATDVGTASALLAVVGGGLVVFILDLFRSALRYHDDATTFGGQFVGFLHIALLSVAVGAVVQTGRPAISAISLNISVETWSRVTAGLLAAGGGWMGFVAIRKYGTRASIRGKVLLIGYPMLAALLWTPARDAADTAGAVTMWLTIGAAMAGVGYYSATRSTMMRRRGMSRRKALEFWPTLALAVGAATTGSLLLARTTQWSNGLRNGVTFLAFALAVVSFAHVGWAAKEMRRVVRQADGLSGWNWMREHEWWPMAADAALEEWDKAVTEKAIVPFLRLRMNQLETPDYSIRLAVHDAPGLRQMSAGEHLVRTRVFQRYGLIADVLAGGTVGIAGPRGAGKTTFLAAYKEGVFLTPGEQHLVVMESVPVGYDAREFTLHLYAQVCQATIKFLDERRRRRNWARIGKPLAQSFGLAGAVIVGLLAVAYLGTSIVRAPRESTVDWLGRIWPPMAILLAAIVAAKFLRTDRRFAVKPDLIDLSRIADARQMREQAERKLAEIRFQQKHTTGWSGKLNVSVADASRTRTVEATRQAMTYPEVSR
jgi:hypothetical protein